MLVTFVRATVAYFEGAGLCGFIEVDRDGKKTLYEWPIPTAADPSPPGWATLEALAKVTATEIITGWDPTGNGNPVAEQLALDLTARFVGEPFVAREEVRKGRGPIVHLALVDTNLALPRSIGPAPAATSVVAPILYTRWHKVTVEAPPGDPALLVIQVDDVDTAVWPRFRIPDANDRTPDAWWFVETFTGISHERVAAGWQSRGNTVLDDTMKLLAHALEGHQVPLLPEPATGPRGIDLARWRRELIQARLRQGLKPFVFLGRPDHNIEHTRAVLADAAGDFLFVTGVEPGEPSGMPAMIRDAYGKAALQHLDDEDVLRGILNRFIRFVASGRPPKPKQPPRELLADLIHYPDRSWNEIKGIVRLPTVRPDGTIITQAGYDRAAQLWYAPEFELPPIPDRPSDVAIDAARAIILTPLTDFPFLGEGSRTMAVACLFEQLVRPMIQGPRPLYIFDAPEGGQGTGKTLLAKVLQVIITGQPPVLANLGRKEEEYEKRITTYLRQQTPFVIIDNLKGVIDSAALAQLATSERWRARLLNTNDSPIYDQVTTWVLTLNAAQMDRDIARRAMLCRLKSNAAVVYERTGFKIPDGKLLYWARAHRAQIVHACLVLVRSWVADGCPKDPDVIRGSFEEWCAVIGGLMKHAKFPGLPDALKVSAERDVNADDHRFLLKVWLDAYTLGVERTASELGALAQEHGIYEERLAKKQGIGLGRAMQTILTAYLVDKNINGFTVKVHPGTNYNKYSIAVVDPGIAFN